MARSRRLIPLALLLSLALPSAAQAFFKCMPLYGNWCGVDYPPPGSFPPPVDAFDAACMRHDLCTGRRGFGNAVCDRALVADLERLRWQYGGLPRPLQWAEYFLRVKEGGAPWAGMPLPHPGDAMGFMDSLLSNCR